MKIRVACCIVSIWMLSACKEAPLKPLETTINAEMDQMTLTDSLEMGLAGSKYVIDIAPEAKAITDATTVSLHAQAKPLKEVLGELLDPHGLEYQLDETRKVIRVLKK